MVVVVVDMYNPTVLMPPACPVRRRRQMTPPCAFIHSAFCRAFSASEAGMRIKAGGRCAPIILSC